MEQHPFIGLKTREVKLAHPQSAHIRGILGRIEIVYGIKFYPRILVANKAEEVGGRRNEGLNGIHVLPPHILAYLGRKIPRRVLHKALNKGEVFTHYLHRERLDEELS